MEGTKRAAGKSARRPGRRTALVTTARSRPALRLWIDLAVACDRDRPHRVPVVDSDGHLYGVLGRHAGLKFLLSWSRAGRAGWPRGWSVAAPRRTVIGRAVGRRYRPGPG